MEVREIINEYIINNHLSVREFARRCGLSHAYISRIINGQAGSLTTQSLNKVAKGMNMQITTLVELLDDDETVTIENNIFDQFANHYKLSDKAYLFLNDFVSTNDDNKDKIIDYGMYIMREDKV